MRGAPGTDIAMVVKRYGEEDLKNFSVSRSEINIPNVPHYEILEGGYGYVHLSQFTDNSSLNIVNAIKEMKKEQELNGIILDLRFNGGGLLREAIGVTNIFVNKDEEIVSTKGKVLERDRIFKTTMSPLDTLSPVVVLINGRSASASEIVSGAIQDLDRGVLVGQRSFGKGLVQNTQKVGYNSQIKLTTSKYYIPSGRCIQSVAYENGEPVHIPDEERKAFKTKIGRKVLDGGGVKPDINVEKQEIPEFVQFLLKKNVIFKYANGFCAKHDSIAEVGSFHFEDYEGFKKMFNDMNLDFNSKLENSFLKFSEELESSGKTMVEDQLVQQIKGQLQQESAELLNKNKDLIINEIEKEIISRYYFLNGKIRYSLLNDVELETAIEILNNPIKYKEILSVIE
jgi:carboxyl-terminal processing protease